MKTMAETEPIRGLAKIQEMTVPISVNNVKSSTPDLGLSTNYWPPSLVFEGPSLIS